MIDEQSNTTTESEPSTVSVEVVMRMFTRFARYLAPGVLVACVVSMGAPFASSTVTVALFLLILS